MKDVLDKEGEVEERRRILRQKVEGNSQRNARRDYLASLPDDLSRYLSKRNFLPVGDFEIVSTHFLIFAKGFGKPPVKPEGYRFREFAWQHKVLEEAQKLDARHDLQPAFFYPFGGNPVYQVEFGWVRANLSRLLHYRIGSITVDGSAGLVIDKYCGYVEGDLNPDEVVYELAAWGFSGDYEPRCSTREPLSRRRSRAWRSAETDPTGPTISRPDMRLRKQRRISEAVTRPLDLKSVSEDESTSSVPTTC